MDTKASDVHDLLQKCADGLQEPGSVAEELIAFSKSDLAPDPLILSDLLLDTLFLYDTAISHVDEAAAGERRTRLGTVVAELVSAGCANEKDAYDRLEPSLLQAAGLIGDAKAFEKRQIRINTNLLYRQQKFNLLREENEGFAKLIVEFQGFLATSSNTSDLLQASQLLSNIQSVIGYFDLDPNRVLDILYELAANSLLTHWRLILKFFGLSPWFSSQPEIALNPSIDQKSGSYAAAQILGFKFAHLVNSNEDLQPLYLLAALMVKENFISLAHLWGHLAPNDADFQNGKQTYQNRMLEALDQAKGRNALALAGGLDDEPTSTQMQDLSPGDIEMTPTVNQKIGFCHALFAVGSHAEMLFLLSEYPYLLNANPDMAVSFTLVLEAMLEHLWSSLRVHIKYTVADLDGLQQPRKIPEELKYRDSTLILPKAAKVKFVLDPHSRSPSREVREVFFYDQISSQVRCCESLADIANTLPYVRLAGVQLHRNIRLLVKLAKIGKAALNSDAQGNIEFWTNMLRQTLLPCLSLVDANPALVNDIHALIRELSVEQRYALYGEWYASSYKAISELKIQFVKTEKETKGLLRRISKTNTKEYGRRLAKVSHSNPCIVLHIALNQIESYDNLVDVVIEASRYFTLLTFDVLVYILLTLLSNNQKRRLKEDGTSVAHWLQSLSSFTAKIFKRYSHMDPGPICTYVAKQLKLSNAFDLIILRDLLVEMAQIAPTSDLSDEQLRGCTGGALLKVQALTLINEKRDPTNKVPSRLLNSLERLGLAYPLLLLISQRRSDCIYTIDEEASLLKLLGNIADETHQVLIQYQDFLTLYGSLDTYDNQLPSADGMTRDLALEPAIAFMLKRPSIAKKLRSETAQVDEQTREQDLNLHCLASYEESVRTIFPDICQIMHPQCITAFWALSMYDLAAPEVSYEKELGILRQAPTIDGRHIHALEQEKDSQVKHTAVISRLFEQARSSWFSLDPSSDQMTEASQFSTWLLYHCLLPRAVLTPDDAVFCAAFCKRLHVLGFENIDVLSIYEIIYGPHLATTIFTSTEREAENLGRLLRDGLKHLSELSKDEITYAQTPFRRCLGDDWHNIPFEQYVLVLSTVHSSILTSIKDCLHSKEYMHIRNCLIVLERIHETFPSTKALGQEIQTLIDEIIANEKREDLKIRALGYKAVLKRVQSSWDKGDGADPEPSVSKYPEDTIMEDVRTDLPPEEPDQNVSVRKPKEPDSTEVVVSKDGTVNDVPSSRSENASARPVAISERKAELPRQTNGSRDTRSSTPRSRPSSPQRTTRENSSHESRRQEASRNVASGGMVFEPFRGSGKANDRTEDRRLDRGADRSTQDRREKMPPPRTNDIESTAGRLNEQQLRSRIELRNASQESRSRPESTTERAPASRQEKDDRRASPRRASIRGAAQDARETIPARSISERRSRNASPEDNGRSSRAREAHNATNGARSLASRMSEETNRSDAPRNAPDGPRQRQVSDSRPSDIARKEQAARLSRPDDRRVSERQRKDDQQTSSQARDPERITVSKPERQPAGPPVHPSRAALVTTQDRASQDSLKPRTDQGSRRASPTRSTSLRSDAAPLEPLRREVRARPETRDERSDRSSREAPHRITSDRDRPPPRRDDRAPPRETRDSKRRYPEESRDSRPLKRR